MADIKLDLGAWTPEKLKILAQGLHALEKVLHGVPVELIRAIVDQPDMKLLGELQDEFALLCSGWATCKLCQSEVKDGFCTHCQEPECPECHAVNWGTDGAHSNEFCKTKGCYTPKPERT